MDNSQENQSDLSAHQQAAQNQPHDAHGHFAPKPKEEDTPFIRPSEPPIPQLHTNPVSQFMQQHSNGKDDLLDVHIGNPLKKVVALLEEIKKQKAFNFTLKGSLGVMGVVLTLSIFGILGAGNLLCSKGQQTFIGNIKVLQMEQSDSSQIPFIGVFIDKIMPKTTHMLTVLIKEDQTVIKLPYSKGIDFTKFFSDPVIITGQYDSCSQTLTVKDKSGVEKYIK